VTAQLKLENRRLPSVAASFLGALLAGARALAYCTLGIADAMVSAQIRALMAPQPTDVASPDHDTVKSWFNGKLAFAPDAPRLLSYVQIILAAILKWVWFGTK
jgi:anti-sigma factor RsiW